MEWLFIFALIGACATLWRRLRTLEIRLEAIDTTHDRLSERLDILLSHAAAECLDHAQTQDFEPENPPSKPQEQQPPKTVASVPKTVTLRTQTESESPESDAPPPVPTSLAEQEAPPVRQPFLALDLEDVFGRRLPIWAGGVTLAVAGFFLVRYSIESGLLTPLVRVLMAFLFGLGLLAGAEAAYRFRVRVADPRVAQALAGAGLATLYAGFYLAGTRYGLVGQTMAFLGLGGVTAASIGLSFRFGLPSAILALVGGFAAPALIGGDGANLPLLALYLGLVTAGLTLSGRRQNRPWLGMSALVGGLGWGALLLLAGNPGVAEILALGLYFVVLGAVLPAMIGSPAFERWLRLGSALVASAQLALLVAQGGFAPLAWVLYLLLGAALTFFGWRRPELREATLLSGAIGILLLAQWTGANGEEFSAVGAALAILFAGVPLAHIWRGDERPIDIWQASGIALGLACVAYWSFGAFAPDTLEAMLALTTAALAILPALAAWRLWRRAEPFMLVIPLAASALLTLGAALMLTPGWAAPLAALAVFVALFILLRQRGHAHFTALLWAAAVMALLSLTAFVSFDREFMHLAGSGNAQASVAGLLRWLATGLPFAALSWREVRPELRRLAEGIAMLLGYGALAQILPADSLGWTAAALAIGIFFGLPSRVAAWSAALTIAAAWAMAPIAEWSAAGVAALGDQPMLIANIPVPADALLHILPLAATLLAIRMSRRELPADMDRFIWIGAIPGLITAHILFKQIFAIDSTARFAAVGLVERTVWEALLLGCGLLALRGLLGLERSRALGTALAVLSLAHFTLFTGVLHNPLWSTQAVGSLPFANLVLAAYAVAIGAALQLRQWPDQRTRLGLDAAVMVLVTLGAITLLRQLFAGSILVGGAVTQPEDLLRSLTGIVVALFFLFVGSRTGQRSWRVGSLVIMLAAVAKVFALDAAGLAGLMRVASFMALGFSLIGIGWVYSRQLRSAAPTSGASA